MSLTTSSIITLTSSGFPSGTPTTRSQVSGFESPTSVYPTGQPDPGPGNNGGGGGGSIASSAALYLYTFLATLVLLLTVSAAIVIRSFILRRRHRQMVEEAVRNGTWIPQMDPPGGAAGRGGPRVDLSKKPVMWETHLGGGGGGANYSGGTHAEKAGNVYSSSYPYGSVGGDVKEWDAIKPVSVSYVPAKSSSKPAPLNLPVPVTDDVGGVQQQQSRGVIRRMGVWVADLFRTPRVNAAVQNTQSSSAPQAGEGEVESIRPESLGGQTVRVAVFIAMPRPPPVPRHAHAASASGSTSASGSQSHPLSEPVSRQYGEEEEPLPPLEMGVAEVVVLDGETSPRRSGESGMSRSYKLKDGRDSVSVEGVGVQ